MQRFITPGVFICFFLSCSGSFANIRIYHVLNETGESVYVNDMYNTVRKWKSLLQPEPTIKENFEHLFSLLDALLDFQQSIGRINKNTPAEILVEIESAGCCLSYRKVISTIEMELQKYSEKANSNWMPVGSIDNLSATGSLYSDGHPVRLSVNLYRFDDRAFLIIRFPATGAMFLVSVFDHTEQEHASTSAAGQNGVAHMATITPLTAARWQKPCSHIPCKGCQKCKCNKAKRD